MTPELEKTLAKVDMRHAINDLFLEWGASYEQAECAANALDKKFGWDGASLTFNGKPVNRSDAYESLKKSHPFLLPGNQPDLNKVVVGQDLLDKAFVANSPDARAKVFERLGRDKQKADALAAEYGLRDFQDYRSRGTRPAKDGDEPAVLAAKDNPWSDHPANLDARGRYNARAMSRQGQIIKSGGGISLAASLAEAAGSFVGATKPNQSRAA
jgi:hypothetical protein